MQVILFLISSILSTGVHSNFTHLNTTEWLSYHNSSYFLFKGAYHAFQTYQNKGTKDTNNHYENKNSQQSSDPGKTNENNNKSKNSQPNTSGKKSGNKTPDPKTTQTPNPNNTSSNFNTSRDDRTKDDAQTNNSNNHGDTNGGVTRTKHTTRSDTSLPSNNSSENNTNTPKNTAPLSQNIKDAMLIILILILITVIIIIHFKFLRVRKSDNVNGSKTSENSSNQNEANHNTNSDSKKTESSKFADNQSFTENTQKIGQLDKDVKDLQEYLNENITKINQSFTENIQKIEQLDKDVKDLQKYLNENITKIINFIDKEKNDFSTRIQNLEENNKNLQRKLTDVERIIDQIEQVPYLQQTASNIIDLLNEIERYLNDMYILSNNQDKFWLIKISRFYLKVNPLRVGEWKEKIQRIATEGHTADNTIIANLRQWDNNQIKEREFRRQIFSAFLKNYLNESLILLETIRNINRISQNYQVPQQINIENIRLKAEKYGLAQIRYAELFQPGNRYLPHIDLIQANSDHPLYNNAQNGHIIEIDSCIIKFEDDFNENEKIRAIIR